MCHISIYLVILQYTVQAHRLYNKSLRVILMSIQKCFGLTMSNCKNDVKINTYEDLEAFADFEV